MSLLVRLVVHSKLHGDKFSYISPCYDHACVPQAFNELVNRHMCVLHGIRSSSEVCSAWLPLIIYTCILGCSTCAGEFMRKLSTAIFVLVREDEEAVKAYHASGNGRHTLTPEELQQKDAKYWNTRCRRLVRSATQLKGSLKALMEEFEDARDPELGNASLFTPYTYQVYDAVLELINSGSFCGKEPQRTGQCSRGCGVLKGTWATGWSARWRCAGSALSVLQHICAPAVLCWNEPSFRRNLLAHMSMAQVGHMADKSAAMLCCPVTDPLPLNKMYIKLERGPGRMPRYIVVRGTSQLEGYHKHLIDLFVGSNYSAYLAGALVTMFNFRWDSQIWLCVANMLG